MFKPVYREPVEALIARLTPAQQTAFAQIMSRLPPQKHNPFGEQPQPAEALLTGYAGAGKTFLLSVVARAAQEAGAQVGFAAPTHKAVGVLAEKVSGFPCMTVAKLTGKKASGYNATTGARSFSRDGEKGMAGCYSYIIVDESSMLDQETLEEIRDSAGSASLLFVGDPAQLPPVQPDSADTSAISPIFAHIGTARHVHLGGIVRQAEGNPLMDAALTIREMIESGEFSASWMQVGWHHTLGGVANFSALEADAAAKHAFTSDEFLADPNMYRVVTYSNEAAIAWNERIRAWRYDGRDLSTAFFAGELAVVNEAFAPKDEILLQNNQEVTVASATRTVKQYNFRTHHDDRTSAMLVESFDAALTGYDIELTNGVFGFLPGDMQAYKALDNRLRVEAGRCKGQKHTRAFERFKLNREILHLRHSYALTVHKAQGSTFSNVLVPVADLMRARRRVQDVPFYARLLYTAITRPRLTVGAIQT